MDLVAGNIMTHPVIAAREEMSIGDLIALLREKQISGVPVVASDDRLVGVVSITDLLSLSADSEAVGEIVESDYHTSPAMDALAETSGFLEPEGEVLDRPVRDLMSRNVTTASEQTHIGELADLMISHRIHRVIIVRDEKAVGIVSTLDILRALRDQYRTGV